MVVPGTAGVGGCAATYAGGRQLTGNGADSAAPAPPGQPGSGTKSPPMKYVTGASSGRPFHECQAMPTENPLPCMGGFALPQDVMM